MKESIVIVIAAIVILVIALVLLTIFGQGMNPVGNFAQQVNLCRSSAASSCAISKNVPPGWASTRYRVVEDGNEAQKTCADLTNAATCSELGM